jgi:hypothetical protein
MEQAAERERLFRLSSTKRVIVVLPTVARQIPAPMRHPSRQEPCVAVAAVVGCPRVGAPTVPAVGSV